MPTIPNNAATLANLPLRERILQYVESKFGAVTMVGGEPMGWETIVRAPFSERERKMKTALSIQEGRERYKENTLFTDCFLDLTVEFEVRTYKGEEPATYMNLTLSDVRATMMQDRQLGGLSLNVTELSSQVDISTTDDRTVGGIVLLNVYYRHVTGDPTRAPGE